MICRHSPLNYFTFCFKVSRLPGADLEDSWNHGISPLRRSKLPRHLLALHAPTRHSSITAKDGEANAGKYSLRRFQRGVAGSKAATPSTSGASGTSSGSGKRPPTSAKKGRPRPSPPHTPKASHKTPSPSPQHKPATSHKPASSTKPKLSSRVERRVIQPMVPAGVTRSGLKRAAPAPASAAASGGGSGSGGGSESNRSRSSSSGQRGAAAGANKRRRRSNDAGNSGSDRTTAELEQSGLRRRSRSRSRSNSIDPGNGNGPGRSAHDSKRRSSKETIPETNNAIAARLRNARGKLQACDGKARVSAAEPEKNGVRRRSSGSRDAVQHEQPQQDPKPTTLVRVTRAQTQPRRSPRDLPSSLARSLDLAK